MSAISPFYVLPFLCNCLLVSSSILAPLKNDESLRIFKESPNDFEYVLKRPSMDGRAEDPELKERRSNMGSSFIRFGRSQSEGNLENAGFGGDVDSDSKVNRYPRWKSPDIVIRFGRSGYKATDGEHGSKRTRHDLNFIRFGRSAQAYPFEIDLSTLCSELLSNDVSVSRDFRPHVVRLLRLCNILENYDDEHRSNLDFLDEQADSKHN